MAILNDSIPIEGESKFLVNDIKLLCTSVGIIKSLAMFQSENSFAFKLACAALVSVRERLWVLIPLILTMVICNLKKKTIIIS